MNIQDYQKIVDKTAVYPEEFGLIYTALGLVGEVGEVAEKVKKVYRDQPENIRKALEGKESFLASDLDSKQVLELRYQILKEVGDIGWYMAAIAKELGSSLEEVLTMNYDKLLNRKANNTLHGSGDNR